MNPITVIVLIFCLLGAADKLLGNKFGLGQEFEKGFALFSAMAFSMLGMLVVAPAVGVWLTPSFEKIYNAFGIDPSIIPASLFANDMGGYTVSQAVCKDGAIGAFNAFVVSSMMGAVISFTIPFSLSVVKPAQQKDLSFGLLCGIITVPVGCFVAGLMCGIRVGALLLNLLPLLMLSVIIAAGMLLIPKICLRIFTVFGKFMQIVAILGLVFAIFTFLTKVEISPHFDSLENSAFICVNACVTLAGMLVLMRLVTRLLQKPMERLGKKVGLDHVSAVAFLSNMVTNVLTFGAMDQMNRKGVVLNAAFAVSAAFALGSHLAFTMAFDSRYIVPVIVGKLISGIAGVALAAILFKEKPE